MLSIVITNKLTYVMPTTDALSVVIPSAEIKKSVLIHALIVVTKVIYSGEKVDFNATMNLFD